MRLLIATWLLLYALGAGAEDKKDSAEVEVNYLELAALLVSDGNYERADSALAQVDLNQEGLDLARYYTVLGLLRLNQSRHEEARDAIQSAIQNGQADPSIQLYLAQAHFALKAWPETLAALAAAGDASLRLPGSFLIRAQCHWNLGEHQRALDVLGEGSARFPEQPQFLNRQVFYLVELGLYQDAADLGRRYLSVTEGTENDYVAIGNALRRAKQFDDALRFLEAARLRFPESVNVAKVLAHTYLDSRKFITAAEILAGVALREPKVLPEAAELFRRGGHLTRALSLNAQIADQPAKLKQRLAILLELKRYDQVASMEDALARAALLADEDVRYALAFAYFQSGRYDDTERHLKALTRTDLFRKATELRTQIVECRAEPSQCV